LVRKNNPATGSDASRSCTKNSDSCGMAIEMPRPAKNRLAVALRYSGDRSTTPNEDLGLAVMARVGIRSP